MIVCFHVSFSSLMSFGTPVYGQVVVFSIIGLKFFLPQIKIKKEKKIFMQIMKAAISHPFKERWANITNFY